MKFNYTKYQNSCKNILASMIDSTLSVSVTYKKQTGSTYNPSAGTNTETYAEYSIDVIRNDVSLEAQKGSSILSGISFSAGQKYYIVHYDDLPRSPHSQDILKDYIVDGDKEYQVKKAVPIQGLLVLVQV